MLPAVVLAHDHDHLVGGKRPGASRFLHQPNERADRPERAEQDEGEKSAHARQSQPPWPARRSARRRGGSPSAGLLARLNRLTRGREAFPSPES